MSKIVNLNRARKQKQRSDKRATADANAVKFGRTRAEKTQERSERDQAARRLDGHRLDGHGRDDPDG
ncbi:hypothetical protein OB2597_03459 [Pseudooceanicola batsensis HTCC2597]|uniref:Uncharacterized protein n=1 Tax=Pseudooceanicola batsensis (strain ATCC BAA-863 / DSM 15984 / KCTC 12145 / HTCC2597) TaxID=252305 RepID=A3U416_PSEBH|nr:DUF4169 family protein [Pseudooceanicola batsensis]EAQ01063.1 hypothetical protein OB2597_03459 [Pseudooceanicola batsensis HTCC2597]